MKTRAAILTTQPGTWSVEEVDLSGPQNGEVVVELTSAGLCHSDDHMATGDVPFDNLPFNGGHEGAGVVVEVGVGVTSLAVGDHVLTSFVPECGRCRPCVSGRPNICDRGAQTLNGSMPDGTFRMHLDGSPVGGPGGLGTFAEFNVFHEASCIKIRDDIPLDVLAIIGCAVPTGWGSAVHAAQVQPGDIVIVQGIGGIGASALQGARHVGASRVIAVDKQAHKRDIAKTLGATDFFTTMAEATDLARSLTNGQGADAAIISVGVITSEDVGVAFSAIRKAGTVAVTAIGNVETNGIPINLVELAMYQKRIQGVIFGNGSPRREIQRLTDMYAGGELLIDEMITRRYSLDEVNQGYEDMRAGRNIRGLIDLK